MAVTLQEFAKSLGFAAVPSDSTAMQRCLDVAEAVILPHLIDPAGDYQDNPVYEQCVYTLAGEEWRGKDATRGVYGSATGMDTYPSGLQLPRNVLPLIWPKLAHVGLVKAVVVA